MTLAPSNAFRRRVIATAATLALTAGPATRADIRLPRVFGSHMVLQQGQPVPVWGWAAPNEEVTVEFAGQKKSAKADAGGAWSVELDPMPASAEPRTMTVSTSGAPSANPQSALHNPQFTDVLVGEVWLCSGQSNMEFPVSAADRSAEEIAAANWPQIRHIGVPKLTAGAPQTDVKADWQVCSPTTAGGFTAVGYFFARELHRQLQAPVGLVHSSWGGTRIEPWTPPSGFPLVPSLAGIHRQVELADPKSDLHKARLREYLSAVGVWTDKARASLDTGALLDPIPTYPVELEPLTKNHEPCALYHAMIHPLVPFALRGALWYQGESNHGEGRLYTDKMRALVEGWRGIWNQGPFPFYYVQIAPFPYGEEDPFILPVFWEAQEAALAITNTGMAVIHDVGDVRDIHPRNKQEVGRRLALLALAKTYGRTDTVFSGPVFQSLTPEGTRLRMRFSHADGGLVARDGQPLTHFEIIGEGTDFVPATAVVEGDSVLLSSPGCTNPVAVRFGWHKTAEPNLANGAGLPAAPFRAGRVPHIDWLALKVPESKDYRLVYAMDLAKLGRTATCEEDHSGAMTNRFDRVAYFLELQKPGETLKYLYASMDAFTTDVRKLGLPTLDSGIMFQTGVSNLTVLSNVPGIVNGTAMAGGNIEFWPHNYGPPNSASIPNASGDLWDFGDQPSEPRDGYGCMQIHNHAAKQTLFAINHWVTGTSADIGIGTSEGQTRDWTFAANAGSYIVKRLRVLVRPAP